MKSGREHNSLLYWIYKRV